MRTTLYVLLFMTIGSLYVPKLFGQCPTIFCQDLRTTFMPDSCMVEVWAKDFVFKVDKGEVPVDSYWVSFEEDTLVMNRIFRSSEGNIQEVCIYVAEDPDSCKSKCVVTLTIQDNTGLCDSIPDDDPDPCPIDTNPWCGYALMTCTVEDTNGLVATIIDVRDNTNAPRGDDWANPSSGTAVDFIRPPSWSIENIGSIYGTTTKPSTGEIFFAASDVYAFDYRNLVAQGWASVGFPPPTATGSGGPAGVYRSEFNTDPNLITVTPIITTSADTYLEAMDAIGDSLIPNFGNFDGMLLDPIGATNQFERFDTLGTDTTIGNGLGNIAYDSRSNHLFVSNLEDGKIYGISCESNRITGVFDPFSPYNHAVDGPGIVARGERVWGLEIRNCGETTELYFARNDTSVATNFNSINILTKTIYKVTILESGQFDGSEELVLEVNMGTQDKLSDIAFSTNCDRMLVAERGHPHEARVFEYGFDGSDWVFEKQFFVGINDEDEVNQPGGSILGSSTGGGVTYGAESFDSLGMCDQLVWTSVQCGDAAQINDRCDIYGLEGIDASGNVRTTNGVTDIYIGISPDPGADILRLKSSLGDVEVFSCCCPDTTEVLAQFSGISGSVASALGEPISSEIEIEISTDEMLEKVIVDEQGSYSFEDLTMYQDYKVTSSSIQGPVLDGVTTLDMIHIQRHLLGIQSLDSEYKKVAADVNRSGTISLMDLIEIRKVILGYTDAFRNTDSWVTIPADQKFGSPIWNYQMVENLEAPAANEDFVVLKMGDVNYDNTLYGQSITRSLDRFHIELRRENNTVHFIATENIDLEGLQLELSTSTSNIGIIPGGLNIESSNYFLDNRNLRISWSSQKLAQVEGGDILFSIQSSSNNLYEDLTISSQRLNPEVYHNQLERREIVLIKDESIINSTLLIAPNPVQDRLNLYYRSADQGAARIDLYDSQGRKVLSQNRVLLEGDNLIEINMQSGSYELMEGVYFVRLTGATNSLVKTFVVSER